MKNDVLKDPALYTKSNQIRHSRKHHLRSIAAVKTLIRPISSHIPPTTTETYTMNKADKSHPIGIPY